VAIATGLCAAITYALIVIWTKSLVHNIAPVAVAFWSYAIVATLVLPFALASERFLPQGEEWVYMFVLGALLTAGAGGLYIRALKDVTAQAAGLLAYLDPVAASLLAWAILGQELGWQVVVGGLAVLAGGALVVLYEDAPEPSPELGSAP
jgi:drug/metabolite transporter (DMT)-like permease